MSQLSLRKKVVHSICAVRWSSEQIRPAQITPESASWSVGRSIGGFDDLT